MTEKEENNGAARRKKKKQKKMLVLVVAIIVVVVAILIALTSFNTPSPYLEVDDLINNISKYSESEVEVAGTVGEINQTENSTFEIIFELKDRNNDDVIIMVEYFTTPEGFVSGKDVVVTGDLVEVDGEFKIKANDIQIGCPSKYE
jgi:cytochrome c-type biogenesis protein CcmE